jgi:N-acetylmuramoyl-L-alanine amidase
VGVFDVDIGPHVLSLHCVPVAAAPPFPQKLTAVVLDRNGNPVKDGSDVEFRWNGGSILAKTVEGEASVFVGREVPSGATGLKAACGGISGSLEPNTSPGSPYVSGFVLDTGDLPLEGATVTAPGIEVSAVTDRYGFFVLDGNTPPGSLRISKSGYRNAAAEGSSSSFPVVRLSPFYSALDSGIRVAVDPQGGGAETGWVGPTGITASDLNLAVAERLATLLRSAGVQVNLTRATDREVGGAERVMACESNHSALLLSIAHCAGDLKHLSIEHFPESRGGTVLSEHIADEMKDGLGYDPDVGETAEYIIQQTSCPAVKVSFPTGSNASDEVSLSETYNIWKRAYPLHLAILRYLGVERSATFDVSGRVTSEGRPFARAVVTIDGSLEVLSDARGRFAVKMLEAGRHTAEAFSGGARSQPVDFDTTTGTITLEL